MQQHCRETFLIDAVKAETVKAQATLGWCAGMKSETQNRACYEHGDCPAKAERACSATRSLRSHSTKKEGKRKKKETRRRVAV